MRRQIEGVAAELDFLGGHSIVFVYDRDYSLPENKLERGARVPAALFVIDNASCKKYLRDSNAVIRKATVVHIDKLTLTDGGCRLLLLGGERFSVEACFRKPAGNRTRGNEYYFLSAVIKVRKAGNKLFDLAKIHIARGVRKRGGTHLYDHSFYIFYVYLHIYTLSLFTFFVLVL